MRQSHSKTGDINKLLQFDKRFIHFFILVIFDFYRNSMYYFDHLCVEVCTSNLNIIKS